MITYLNVYLILWILFIHIRDETVNKETQKKNQIVIKKILKSMEILSGDTSVDKMLVISWLV